MKAEQYIRNPYSGRPIRVGGLIYNQLVRDGVIEGEVKLPKYAINIEDDTDTIIEEKKKMLEEELDNEEYEVAVGRGKYEGTLTTKRKRDLIQSDITRTKNIAQKVKIALIDNLDEILQSNDIDRTLERILYKYISQKKFKKII